MSEPRKSETGKSEPGGKRKMSFARRLSRSFTDNKNDSPEVKLPSPTPTQTEFEGIIGEGAFGKVKRIERKNKGKANYALKYIDKKKCIEKHATYNMFRERMVLQALQHPYIVNLRYAFQDDDNLFMVLDIADGGDLRCHLDRLKGVKEENLQIYVAEIACALNYLHSKQIIHRDLKPENLLVDRDGHLLLTDFNVCANLAEHVPSSPSGTRPYMAPEMFLNKPYKFSIDWWAVGIIMYECTFGKRPYKVNKDWKYENFQGTPLSFPDVFYRTEVKVPKSPLRDQMIQELLEIDVSKRVGAADDGSGFEKDIKTHPWLKSIEWDLVEQKKLEPSYKPNLKAINVDSSLLIDEIIGGGDGLAYKARRGSRRPSTFKDKFFKIFGIEAKAGEGEETPAEAPVLTREQQEMKEMDEYYTNYNWELPDQKPMNMPPGAVKTRGRLPSVIVSSSVVSSNNDEPLASPSPARPDIIPESPLEEEKAAAKSQDNLNAKKDAPKGVEAANPPQEAPKVVNPEIENRPSR